MELTSKKRNKTKLVAPYTYAECMGISFKNGLYLKMPFLFMLSCTKTLKHFLLMKLKDYFSLVCILSLQLNSLWFHHLYLLGLYWLLACTMPLASHILKLCPIKLNKTYSKLKVVPWEFWFWRESFPPNDMKRMNYKNILLATVRLHKEY